MNLAVLLVVLIHRVKHIIFLERQISLFSQERAVHLLTFVVSVDNSLLNEGLVMLAYMVAIFLNYLFQPVLVYLCTSLG